MNNTLLITDKVVGFPLLIWSEAKASELLTKDLMELKCLVKGKAAIVLSPIRLSDTSDY